MDPPRDCEEIHPALLTVGYTDYLRNGPIDCDNIPGLAGK